MLRNRKAFIPVIAPDSGIAPAPANIWTPQGVALDASIADDQLQVQEPNIIYDGSWRMWYSSGYAARTIHYATSSDGLVWARYGSNPVVANGTRSHVFKVGATYVMYVILSPGGFSKLTSDDGISWTTAAAGVLGGDVGQWDANGPANVFVWIEGATWYCLYEATDGVSGTYKIGLATSPDGETWTKYASNPVINAHPGSVSHPFVHKLNGRYYGWFHVATTGALPTDIAKYNSADLITWTRSPAGLVYPRSSRDEGSDSTSGQVADQCMVEVNGTTYRFHTAMENGAQATGKIKVASAPYGLDRLALSDEGIVTTHKTGLLLNGGFERLGAGGADIFASWTETLGTGGTIERTTGAGEFRSGTSGIAAVKITAGSGKNALVSQSIAAANFVSGEQYIYSGWYRGDGTNYPRVRVNDSGDLIPFTDLPSNSTTWVQFSATFTYPGAGNVVFYGYCPNAVGGISYFDDLSVRHA